MIDAHEVGMPQCRAQSRLPPGKAVLGMARPAIQRIAPQLAFDAEIIGRHAGHFARATVRIEFKQLACAPHLDAVPRHIDRQVADDAYATRLGVSAQRLPLARETPLHETPEVTLGRQPAARCAQCVRIACGELGWPLGPAAVFAIATAQGHEQGIVIEPASFAGAPGAKFIMQGREARRLRKERAGGEMQQAQTQTAGCVEIHGRR